MFHPTQTPQEFESFRTNPQEPSPARTALCQAVDFQQTARSVRACGLRTFNSPVIWLASVVACTVVLRNVGTCKYLPTNWNILQPALVCAATVLVEVARHDSS